MYESTSFVEHAFLDGHLPDRALGVDDYCFGNQRLFIVGDEDQIRFADDDFSSMLEPVKDWNFSTKQIGPYSIDYGSYPLDTLNLLPSEDVAMDATFTIGPADQRVPSWQSNDENNLFALGSWNSPPLSPVPSTAEMNLRGRSKSYWPCAECYHSFPTSQDLESHARSISHKAYRCEECGKGFSRRDTFGRHVATHNTAAGNHACKACEQDNKVRIFKRKDHLEQHIRNRHAEPSRSIISRMLGNIRSDRYGSGDDIAPMSATSPSGSEANPDLQIRREMQDLASAFERIISKGEYILGMHGEPPWTKCSLEDVKEIRGFARLALSSPYNLSLQTKERLLRILQTLEAFDSSP